MPLFTLSRVVLTHVNPTATDKPHAARELMFQLPADLLSTSAASAQPDDASQVREYLDYSSLFQCLEKHTRWAEIWARKPRPSAPKLDHAAFKDGVAVSGAGAFVAVHD